LCDGQYALNAHRVFLLARALLLLTNCASLRLINHGHFRSDQANELK
jgi:hypothetical protein